MQNTLSLAIFSLLAGHSHPVLAQQPVPTIQTQTRPIEPTEGTVNWPYWGTVTERTKESITIRFGDDKPKKFAVSETLAAGMIPKEPRLQPGQTRGCFVSTPDMYRLSDVKVGDWVMITHARLGGEDVCDHIRISKATGRSGSPSARGSRKAQFHRRKDRQPRLWRPWHRKCWRGFARWTRKGFGITNR